MSLFDLLFIVFFLTAAGTLLFAGWHALRRRFASARLILFRLVASAAAYMAIVITVSLFSPRRMVKLGDRQCFDDMCVAVAGFNRTPERNSIRYRVDVELSSRARRVAQRENNLAVYLTDDRGRRFNPVADRPAAPFNVLLGPGASVMARRSFVVPAEAAGVSAVIAHEGGFPIGWFIIDYDTWFRSPPLIPLALGMFCCQSDTNGVLKTLNYIG